MGRDHTDTLKAGDTAPDFTLESSAGGPIALAGYRGKQPVLLVFVRGTM